MPAFDWRGLALGVVKCAVASGLMGVALYFFVYFSGAPEAIAPRVIQLAIALALGGAVYLEAAAILRVPELSYLRRVIPLRRISSD